MNSTIFFKADFQNKIQTIFSSILEKYRLLGIKYDEETDHSNNQAAQDNWNNFFAGALQ
jgi:chemotaxis methyl-accepting protein methylase